MAVQEGKIIYDDEAKPPSQEKAPARSVAVKEGKIEYDLDRIIARAAETYKLDPLLLRAIIQRESGGKVDAVGPDTHAQPGQKAKGLMQLMDGTAKDMGVTDPFDPEQNIMGGARYLRQLLDHPAAGGDVGKALLHYVGGRDPKQWGAQSFAYPHLVLEEYRKLGGRLQDPQVPKVGWLERAANASLPFDGAKRVLFGKGPDLSQGLSGPEANRPVGAKLKDWLASISPQRAIMQKAMDNYADDNPILAASADVVGGLPANYALGQGVNAGLNLVGTNIPAVAPMMKFLSGNAGRGLPATGEGASLATRIASGGAQGALQGAVGGAAFSHLSPDTSVGDNALFGAGVGGTLGAAVPAGVAAWNRALFGKRIDPTTAGLLLDAKNGVGMPKIPLSVDTDQANNFSLNPMQFSRVAGEMVGEPTPFRVEGAKLRPLRKEVGEMFDTATPKLSALVDRDFLSEFHQITQKYRTDPNVKRELQRLPQYKAFTGKLSNAVHVDGGILSGEDIHAWTKQGKVPGIITQLIKSTDPNVRQLGSELKTLLDDSLEKGTAEQVSQFLAQGRMGEAAEKLKMLSLFKEAKAKYRLIEPIEQSLNPITQRVEPGALYNAAAEKGGEIEKLARAGLAADPARKAAHTGAAIPYTGLAAAASLATQDHVTTGKAVLAALGLNKLGRGVMTAASHMPGYQNALLNRSKDMFAPGSVERGLRNVLPKAGVLGGVNLQGRGE